MTPKRPVALVTGSGTGVGRACALRLAKLGFDIFVNYSRSQQEAEETRRLVSAIQPSSDESFAGEAWTRVVRCDVSDESAVRRMIDEIAEQRGRLDVLVNNAATTHFIPGKDLDEMTEEKWDRILAVNLKGPFFCIKAAADLLGAGEGGAVVNVSSVAGLSGLGSSIAYAASKGALNTLTKSFAHVLAPAVRVNAVLPGPIDSRWIREGDNQWDLDEMTADFPIPRASQPDDIADAVIYLATGTSMTTGQLLVVDGGKTI